MLERTEDFNRLARATAGSLRGVPRRQFMARTVQALGYGGQRYAEAQLGWNRVTIRKGLAELKASPLVVDHFAARGRWRAEQHLPNLLGDIKDLVTAQSQADPRFRTLRLYTRLTAEEVRRQLIAQKGYRDAELPTARTLRTKLDDLGFRPTKVLKCRPKKRFRKPTRSSHASAN